MARKWETIISYEDRSVYHTSRWRLEGIRTKESSENTDSGVLWLDMSKSGDTVTADIYKDDGLGSADKVATGTADVSGVDGTGANAVELVLTEANASGLSGSFWIHAYASDGSSPVQVALCVDEDLDALWDGVEGLNGYDATVGAAESIRVAGEDVIGRVTRMFQDQLGGHGSAEAWFITDATRSNPDLRMIANPGQLRLACAYRALEIAIGRDHMRAEQTTYSALRDHFREQFEVAMGSLTLALKAGSGDNADSNANITSVRLDRA